MKFYFVASFLLLALLAGYSSLFSRQRQTLLASLLLKSFSLGLILWILSPGYLVVILCASMVFADLLIFTYSASFLLKEKVPENRKNEFRMRAIFFGAVMSFVASAAVIMLWRSLDRMELRSITASEVSMKNLYTYLWGDGWWLILVFSLLFLVAIIGAFLFHGREGRDEP